MEEYPWNIVILPEKEIGDHAIRLSRDLAARFDTWFTLDDRKFRPHITIYQGSYPEKNLPKVTEFLKNLTKNERSFLIEMNAFSVNYKNFVFWNCEKIPSLLNFHNSIADNLNPLREGLIPSSVSAMIPSLNDEEKKMAETTGSILNYELFLPHITLTRIKNENDTQEVLKRLGKHYERSFECRKIAVVKLGDHGTVSEIIEEFELSK